MALNTTVRATVVKPTAAELNLPATTMLPPGPGNNWGDAAFRPNHSKKQALSAEFSGKANSTYKPMYTRRPTDEQRPEFSDTALAMQTAITATNKGQAESLLPPPPESLEGKVMRFYAYTVEKLTEGPERERIRKVTIMYYLQDDTITIHEPRIPNSGLQGGTLLKRQKVRLTRNDKLRRASINGEDGSANAPEFVNITDFNVQCPVVISGSEYYVYDCDRYTRLTLENNGIEVPEPVEAPEDPAMAAALAAGVRQPKSFESKDLSITHESLHSKGKSVGNRYPDDIMRVQRFLKDSGKMLRFNAYWLDEETNLVRTFEIRYFVEDDTISIVETVSTGDAISKSFLSRRRVPKGGSTSKGVDLTFSGRVNGMREVYLGDEDRYYDADDIAIGETFNLYGRTFHVYDCDECTREYYRNELGINLAPAEDISYLFPKKIIPRLPVPPPTGFGSEEDSKASCKGLMLSPAKKRIPNDTNGETLRFQLKLHKPERHEDNMRSFILTYHLDDDEIMVSEVAIRNTGFTGGKFLRKQRLRKPESEGGDFFKLNDLYKGALLNINGFRFEITAIDKNSEQWLEHKETKGRPAEDLTKVTRERLQTLIGSFQSFVTCRFCTQTEAFRFFDKDADGKITIKEFFEALKDSQITRREEEAVAMLNALDSQGNGHVNYKDFFKAVTDPVNLPRESAVDVSEKADGVKSLANQSADQGVRKRTLKAVKERLEARCLNVFEMFRMISTMPRAYRGRRADMQSLTNSSKDTCITPVQLRRGIDEHLGMRLGENEMAALLHFFFPDLPREEYKAPADVSFRYAVDLKTFQAKFTEMEALGQLH